MIYFLTFLCVVLLYIFFDVNYFLRMAFTIGWSRLFHKRKKIFEKTIHYGVCSTADVDIFLKHMNNARYVRELDFARSCYYDGCGVFGAIRRSGAGAVQAATTIRYRRPLAVFTAYKVTTQLVYWDERSLYIEHEFVSLSDGFVHASALSKQSVTGPKLIRVPEIIEKVEPGARRPELGDELRLWLEFLDESSLKFKRMRPEEEQAAKVLLPRSA